MMGELDLTETLKKAYKALLHAEVYFCGAREISYHEECKEAGNAIAELLRALAEEE